MIPEVYEVFHPSNIYFEHLTSFLDGVSIRMMFNILRNSYNYRDCKTLFDARMRKYVEKERKYVKFSILEAIPKIAELWYWAKPTRYPQFNNLDDYLKTKEMMYPIEVMMERHHDIQLINEDLYPSTSEPSTHRLLSLQPPPSEPPAPSVMLTLTKEDNARFQIQLDNFDEEFYNKFNLLLENDPNVQGCKAKVLIRRIGPYKGNFLFANRDEEFHNLPDTHNYSWVYNRPIIALNCATTKLAKLVLKL